MTKTLVITSGKGGVGKTNLSVNTAIELAKRQQRVCLFDGDLGLANVNILLGINTEQTLDDVIYGSTPLRDIIFSTEYGIDIIPGSSGVERMANLRDGQLAQVIDEFNTLEEYDYFLFDTASGISKGVILFCLAAAETHLVLTAETTSRADAYAVLKVLALNNYKGKVKIVVNKCATVPLAKKTYYHFKSVAEKHLDIDIELGGIVLADPKIETAVAKQKPVLIQFPNCMASQCIRVMVSEFDNEETSDFREFWKRYQNLLHSDLLVPGQEKEHGTPAVNGGSDRSPIDQAKTAPEEKPSSPGLSEAETQKDAATSPPSVESVQLQSPVPLLAEILSMHDDELVSETIPADPALIGMTMALYSSFYSKEQSAVDNLHEILKTIGTDEVSTFLRSKVVRELPITSSSDIFNQINRLWAHSLKCAMVSKGIAQFVGYHSPHEAYLAGLLHDIGRLALLSSPTTNGKPFDFLDYLKIPEKQHSEFGAEILSHWGMSRGIIDATRYQHVSEEEICSSLPLTRIVYLANKLCDQSFPGTPLINSLTSPSFLLDSDAINQLVLTVDERLERLAKRYNISLFIDVEGEDIQRSFIEFKQLAIDYSLTQSLLSPLHPDENHSEQIRTIQQCANLLFGLDRLMYFRPNDDNSLLQAQGYTGCFAADLLESINFRIDSTISQVVRSFNNRTIESIDTSDTLSLADRQLLQVFNATRLLLIPLYNTVRPKGLLVCALPSSEASPPANLKKRLTQFSSQAIKYLTVH